MAKKRPQNQHHITPRNGGWRVQIRRGGQTVSETFDDLSSAQVRRDELLSQIRGETYKDASRAKATTWTALAEDYRTRHPKLGRTDLGNLRRLDESLGSTVLTDITPGRLDQHVEARALEVGPQQIKHEISLCGRVLKWAMNTQGIHLPDGNPAPRVELPPLPGARDRRLLVIGDADWECEEYWIMRAARRSRSPDIAPIITLAIETGMRRGEIATIDRRSFDKRNHVIRLTKTKNGDKRTVPLSPVAFETLKNQPLTKEGEFWHLSRSDGIGQAWRRIVDRARRDYLGHCKAEHHDPDPRMLDDLHFHDLRHEAATRMSKIFANPLDLAAIFGWRDVNMLMIYYRPTPEDYVRRLAEVRAPAPDFPKAQTA